LGQTPITGLIWSPPKVLAKRLAVELPSSDAGSPGSFG
jgi:hypothetical protein